jgi:hypothetical protein
MIPAVIPRFDRLRTRERVVLALLGATLLGSLVFYMHSAYGHGDITLYHDYARAFWVGRHAFRALPAEYPALSLVPFTLTLLPPLRDYVTVFALWMLLLFLATYLAVRRWESARAAQVMGVYLVLGGFATVLGRFDLVPAAATLLAYWAARGRRFPIAYGLLAAGTLLKLYPVFLLPILVLEHYRTLEREPLKAWPPRDVLNGLALFFGVVGAGFAIALALNPHGWLGPFTYASHRPLQVESVPATLLWLGAFVGMPAIPDHSFHSYNLIGPLDGMLSLLSQLVLVCGCLWLYWRQMAGRLAFGRALALCLLLVVVTNRVFSPQYVIWVVPLIAIMEQEYDVVWLVICVLTTVIFPFAYDAAGLHGTGTPSSYPFYFLGLIGLRNLLLMLATTVFFLRSQVKEKQVPVVSQPRSTAA